MPVKMMINIHGIPIMINRLVNLIRVEDCTRLKRVNVTQQTNWYISVGAKVLVSQRIRPVRTFAVHSQKQHAHLKNPLTKQNGK